MYIKDFAVIPKGRPRVMNKAAFTPQRTKTCERTIAWYYSTKGDGYFDKETLSIEVVAGYKDNRRRDLDNIVKTVMDALNGVAYADDNQIIDIFAKKMTRQDDDYLFVKIAAAGGSSGKVV